MTGFDKVLFCKSVAEKLVSVGELCDTGVVCVFDNQQLTTYKKSEVRIEGTKITCDERDPKSRLYPMTLLRKKGETVTEAMAMTVVVSTTDLVQEIGNMETLPATVGEAGIPSALLAKVYLKPGLSEIDRYHAKFGDIGVKYLKRCLPKLKIPNQYRCDVCIDGKIHRFGHKACKEGMRPTYEPGTCIHSDHSGPYARSISGARYSQLYLDRGSGYLWAARQTKKTGHYESTPRVFVDAWGLSGNRVQVFQSDGDGVFLSKETRAMLDKEHVRHEMSAPYDSDTNSFIERARRTVFEGVATALLRSGAPPRFWGEAECHRIYTINILPIVEDPEKPGAYCSRKNLLQKNRCPANLDRLMAFGTAATCYVPAEQRRGGKDPAQRRSFKGVILGYAETMPAYRVWDLGQRKIKQVSYNFTICHEGYYPFKEKANWPPESVHEPVYFSPRCSEVISRQDLEKYDFDEE
jgi:hypothetical protein